MSFRKAITKIAEQAGGGPNMLPCKGCNTPTAWETLSLLGARCRPCFEAYCSEGMTGGAPGYLTGANDTPQQAEMRKRLKANRPTGQAMAKDDDVDTQMRDQAKRETARRVAEYAQRTGQPGTDTRHARAFGEASR